MEVGPTGAVEAAGGVAAGVGAQAEGQWAAKGAGAKEGEVMVEAVCSHPRVLAAREEAAMAAAEMEEEGLEVEMAGDTREVVTAEARMEDEEAAQQVEVTKVEETGKAAEVMVAELTEAAAEVMVEAMAMGGAAMARGAVANECAASANAVCGYAVYGNESSRNSRRRNRTHTILDSNGSTSVGRDRDVQNALWWRQRPGRPRIRM